MSCEHQCFQVRGAVARLTDGDDGPVTGYSVDFTVWCNDCQERFQFVGAKIGYSPAEPMVSADGFELRCPIAPGYMRMGPLERFLDPQREPS